MSRPLPRRGSSFTPQVKQQAVMRYFAGEPTQLVSKSLGISEYLFHVWVCAAKPQPDDYVRALDLLKKGASRHAVREAFGGKMPLSNLQIIKFKKAK